MKNAKKKKSRPGKSTKSVTKSVAQMSYDQMSKLAATACGDNGDHESRVEAFLLLMDEIERSQRDPFRIDQIQNTARQAAYAESNHSCMAYESLIISLRHQMGLPTARV